MNPTRYELRGAGLAVWLVSLNRPVNFAFVATISGTIDEDTFRQALDRLLLRHPALGIRLEQEENRKVYVTHDPSLQIPLRTVAWNGNACWLPEVTTELALNFDGRCVPPVRFVWRKGEGRSQVLLVCPHAFADGLSAKYVLRDLLQLLGDPTAVLEPILSPAPMTELIPEFRGRMLASLPAHLVGQAARRLLPLLLKSPPADDPESSPPPRYAAIYWTLPEEVGRRLADRCRAEGTTVHTALCTAFLRAFARLRNSGWKRKLSCPVNVRPELSRPIGETFGLFITIVEMQIDCSPPRPFWDIAREIRQTMLRKSRGGSLFLPYTVLNVLMDNVAPVLTPPMVIQISGKPRHDLSVTNLGRLDIPLNYGDLRLESLYGPCLSGNPDEVILGVNSLGGVMHLTLGFTDRALTSAQAEQVRAEAMSELEDAVNG